MSKPWPLVPLGEVLIPVSRPEIVDPQVTYRILGAHWYAEGLYIKEVKPGAQIQAAKLYRVEEGDFIYNRLFAWKGSFALATKENDGCYVSNEFPSFAIRSDRADGLYLWRYFSRASVWEDALGLSTGGTPTSRNRLKEEKLLTMRIPLPPLSEQQQIVARIEELVAKIEEAQRLRKEIESGLEILLSAAFQRIAATALRVPMSEVAPLTRRPVSVDLEQSYPQVAVRSFGRGTFHKPALAGKDITWQKPYLVKAGDILISNIKAWEGAIAVARLEDDGRVGSHRYLTCVPVPSVATARFICFHLLTPEGLHEIGEASPGSADRNRTLNSKMLLRVPIPVPPFEQQVWFDQLCHQVDALKRLQAETAAELDALLPSVLDKAFKGELQ